MVQVTSYFLRFILGLFGAHSVLPTNLYLNLFVGPQDWNSEWQHVQDQADGYGGFNFVAPLYETYAPVSFLCASYGAAFESDEDGCSTTNPPSITFTPSNNVIPSLIQGWFVSDGSTSSANVLYGEVYENAVPLNAPSDHLQIIASLGLNSKSDFGDGDVLN